MGERQAAVSDAGERWRSLVRGHVRDYERAASEACWSPELECAPRARIEEIQSEKLAGAYAYLWERSAFYRRKFEEAGLAPHSIRGLEDLHRIPITRPAEWVEDQQASPPWGTFSPLRHEDWLERGWMLFTTSGTKAKHPRIFRHTTFDRDMWTWHGARALWAMGVRRGDVAFNCFSYGTSVAFWGLHHALNHMGVPVISGGGATTERRGLFIRECAPTVLLTTPSFALHLGRELELSGLRLREGSVRLLVCAGEPGPCVPATKRRLEDLWGARVHDDFGCTEVAMSPLGYTCREQVEQSDHPVEVHLMEDQYIVEVLRPGTLEPAAEGEKGMLVVSNLFSEAQPILRFAMGDWISVTRSPCLCGRTHARAIGGLQGRSDDLVKIRGLKFFPAGLEDAVRSISGVGDEFKLEITNVEDVDHLVVTVEPFAPMEPQALGSWPDVVARELKGTLGIEVNVVAVPFGTLPRATFKAKRLFDLRGE